MSAKKPDNWAELPEVAGKRAAEEWAVTQDCPIVCVVWSDPTSPVSAWDAPADVDYRPTRSLTIGWLYKDTDDVLVTVGSVNGAGMIGDVMVIPQSNVVEIIYLTAV